MSARDELRGTLCNTICNASLYTKRAQPHLLGSDMSPVLDKTADAILAAGYSKPRSITTVAELDALPVTSVLLSRWLHPWQVETDDDGERWYLANAGTYFTSEMLLHHQGPFMVIWEPAA